MNTKQINLIHQCILDLEKIPEESRKFFLDGKQRFVFTMLEKHKNDKTYLRSEYIAQITAEGGIKKCIN